MKRLISLFFLWIILQSIGIAMCLFVGQIWAYWEQQQEIRGGVADNSVQIIEVSEKSELQWMGQKEVVWKGRWMDVIKQETTANHTLKLYCIEDRKEQDMHRHLSQLFSKQNPHHSNIQTILFPPLYWQECLSYIPPTLFLPNQRDWHFVLNIPLGENGIELPPPNV